MRVYDQRREVDQETNTLRRRQRRESNEGREAEQEANTTRWKFASLSDDGTDSSTTAVKTSSVTSRDGVISPTN